MVTSSSGHGNVPVQSSQTLPRTRSLTLDLLDRREKVTDPVPMKGLGSRLSQTRSTAKSKALKEMLHYNASKNCSVFFS